MATAKARSMRIGYCEVCGSNQRLTAHHIDPSTKNNEQPCDIATLCRECHRELHSLTDRGWMDLKQAHFLMWMSDNRKYTSGIYVSKDGRDGVPRLNDLAKVLGVTKAQIRKMLFDKGYINVQGCTKEKAITDMAYCDGKWIVNNVKEALGGCYATT